MAEMTKNKIEYSKPEGCQAVATVHGYSDSAHQTITVFCGDRRAELSEVTWRDNNVVLATEMILGFCVNCPNKIEKP